MTDERRSTPRTDAEESTFDSGWIQGSFVDADFARELEREAAGLRDAMQKARNRLNESAFTCFMNDLPQLVDEVEEMLDKALAGEAGNTSNEQ